MKIAKNIEMLEIGAEFGVMYPTLLWDDHHLVLIDAGDANQIESVKAAISKAGFSAEQLTTVILTHQDLDHIGGVPNLQAIAPSVKILAHEAEAPYMDGRQTPARLAAMEAGYANLSEERKREYNHLKAVWANLKIHIDQTLSDKEVLPICGGIEAVHTPGHMPGHICLYLRESRVMVGGDALNIENGKLVGPNPGFTQDIVLGNQSLEKVKSYDIQAVVAYHGGLLKLK
ncbi:MAG: MBL fold metallo-hydrolase [Peptococcaceae bacterium]|nr:MBL fold metallo-hydrolase [Peptococcaceae bacterium]